MSASVKKSIVIFYSRTGNTQFVAEEIATLLDSDIKPLLDRKNRKGFWGYLLAGRDSILEKQTQIENFSLDLSDYDLIFLGCPNWAANIPPALRTFLSKFNLSNKRVALFCTQDGMGAGNVFNNLRVLTKGAEIIGEKFFNKVNLNKDAIRLQVKEWIEKFKN